MILIFWEARLLKPMDWYNNLDRPFDQPLPIWPVIVSFVLQMALESLTDIFCCVMEERQRLPLLQTYKSVKRYLLVGIVLLTSIHTTALLWTFVDPNFYGKCYGDNVCKCTGNGLHPGGLLDRWCTEWMYPETGGLPPTTTATPTADVAF